ncbi:hypothetical protein C9374_011531 [Naegleria lovaniensis]|uniref:Uncharacterized protein n=1 Tax=Naegleria lovaniensis TaxID=51637 RepID=A0AA88H2P5_NAELO|nr:uncharacterized protein C9374_011531 [Naegleria lovaniensis]KAG2392806.1 hypothetical protein C9374_011531 [Naegleria lovaniensis]
MLSKLKDSFKKKSNNNKKAGDSSSSFDSASDPSHDHSVATTLSNLANLNDSNSAVNSEAKKKSVRKIENEGYLLMQLIGATNLKSADVNGLSDPFCSIRVKNSRLSESVEQFQKTEVIKKTLDPRWNSFFFFDVIELADTFVEFEVYDYDRLSKNDLLGGCAFKLSLLTPYIQTELSIGLDTQGSVECSLMYIPQNTFGFLMKKCIETKSLYVDKDFPGTITSICSNEDFLRNRGIEPSAVHWMRPKDFCKGSLKPELFLAGIEPADIRQGRVGDCYFLGAIAVAALHPKLIKALFIPSAYNEYGIYQIRLFYNGMWREIMIDDYVPMIVSNKIESKTRSNFAPLFARSIDIEELWVILLEKAYAKLHGSYEAIEGAHSIREAFEHLTGGWSDAIDLTPYSEGKKDTTELFNSMLEWKKCRHLMATSTASDSDFDFENTLIPNEHGIVPKHAYSILDVRFISKEDSPEGIPYRLIKLRNTWGKTEWLGKFSDEWEGWTDTLKRRLNLVKRDDGAFWMGIEDYVQQFNYIYVCRVPITKEVTGTDGFMKEISALPISNSMDSTDAATNSTLKTCCSNRHEYIFYDKKGGACEWNHKLYQNAGGQAYFKDTFFQNPQFRLSLELPNDEGGSGNNYCGEEHSPQTPVTDRKLSKEPSTASSSSLLSSKESMVRVILSIRLLEEELPLNSSQETSGTTPMRKRHAAAASKPNPIGLYIYRNRKAVKTGKFGMMDFPSQKLDFIGETSLKKLSRDAIEIYLPRPNVKKYELEKAEGLHDYTIVACRWYPQTEGSFAVQVCSDYKYVTFESLESSGGAGTSNTNGSSANFFKKVIKSEWNGNDSCGAHWQTSTFSTNPKFLLQCLPSSSPSDTEDNSSGEFLKNPVNFYVESENAKIPFFPYVISLAKFKKWMKQSVPQPLTKEECALFPPNGNEFFTIRSSFDCELATRRDKPVSYLLIMGTPYKMSGNFTVVIKSQYEITAEQVTL